MANHALTEKILQSKTDIERSLTQIEEHQKLFNNNINMARTSFMTDFQAIQKDFHQTLSSLVRDHENLISPLGQKKNQALNQDIENLKSKLIESVSKTRGYIQETSKSFERIVVDLIKQSLSILATNVDKISQGLETIYGTENNAIAVIKENLNNSVDRLKDEYSNKIEQEIERVKSSTNDMMEDISRRLEQFRSETGKISEGGEKDIEHTLGIVIEEISSRFEGSTASLREVLTSLEDKLAEIFQEKNESFIELSEKLTNKISENVEKNSLNIENGVETIVTALETFKNQEKDHVNDILTNIKSSFVHSLDLVDIKSKQEYQTIMDYFRNKLYKEIEEISKNLAKSYDESVNLFDALISQLDKSKTTLEQNRDKIVNGSVAKMTKIGEEMESTLHQMINFLHQNFEQEKSKVQKELDKKIRNINSDHLKRLTALEGTLVQSIQNVASNQNKALDDHKNEMKILLNDQTKEINLTFQKIQDQTKGDFQSEVDKQVDWLETSNSDIRRRIQDDQYKFVQVLANIAPQIETIAGSFQATKKDSFDRAMVSMDSASNDFKSEVSNMASEMYGLIEQQLSSIANQIEDRQAENKQLLTKTKSQIQKDKEITANQFQEQSIDSFKQLEDRLSDLEPILAQNIEQIGIQFKQQTDKFFDQKQSQNTELAQKNKNFTEKSKILTGDAKDTFEDLNRNVSVQLENVIIKTKKIITSSQEFVNSLNQNQS